MVPPQPHKEWKTVKDRKIIQLLFVQKRKWVKQLRCALQHLRNSIRMESQAPQASRALLTLPQTVLTESTQPSTLLPSNRAAPEWFTVVHVVGWQPPKQFIHINHFNSVDWIAAVFVLFLINLAGQVSGIVSSCRHCLTMEMNMATFIFVRNYVKLFKFIGELQQTSQLMNITVICF